MLQIRKLLTDNRGVGTIEYALIASLISIAAISGYENLGVKVQESFNSIDQNLAGKL